MYLLMYPIDENNTQEFESPECYIVKIMPTVRLLIQKIL